MAEGTRQLWSSTGRLPEGLIYPELVHAGLNETLVQNTNAFNGASLNTIRTVAMRSRGDFRQESFFKNVTGLVNRRVVEPASPENVDVTANPIPISEQISVKCNRRLGPVEQTLDSFRKLGGNPDMQVVSFSIGEQLAKAIEVDYLNSALTAVQAAITNQATLTNGPFSPERTIVTQDLVDLMALFGDAGSRIKVWVMHSKTYYDLVGNQIAGGIDGISNFALATATPVTLNRPVLVTDSTALVNGSTYTTLGLTEDAVVVEESEEPYILNELVGGKDNLVVRMQGETAFNIGCKGTAFDVANGGVNPDDTALGTGSNWDSVMDNVKDLPGVAVQTL